MGAVWDRVGGGIVVGDNMGVVDGGCICASMGDIKKLWRKCYFL